MFGRRMFLWSTAAALIGTTAACSGESTEVPTQPTDPPPTGPASLEITEIVIGEGAEATTGRSVFIHYTVWHFDPAGADQKGVQIETSRGGQAFGFPIGTTAYIPGLSLGVAGMKVGGQRRFIVPPNLGYGGTGFGNIRPNEWIVFEAELLAVA